MFIRMFLKTHEFNIASHRSYLCRVRFAFDKKRVKSRGDTTDSNAIRTCILMQAVVPICRESMIFLSILSFDE